MPFKPTDAEAEASSMRLFAEKRFREIQRLREQLVELQEENAWLREDAKKDGPQ